MGSRFERASLLPRRGLLWGVIGLLAVVSVLWPVDMVPEVDLLRLPGRAAQLAEVGRRRTREEFRGDGIG